MLFINTATNRKFVVTKLVNGHWIIDNGDDVYEETKSGIDIKQHMLQKYEAVLVPADKAKNMVVD